MQKSDWTDWATPRQGQPRPKRPEVDDAGIADILNYIADVYSIHPNDILGTRKEKPVVIARHRFIAEVMREYKFSLSHASDVLGWDRDTIRNALKKNLLREVEEELILNGYI